MEMYPNGSKHNQNLISSLTCDLDRNVLNGQNNCHADVYTNGTFSENDHTMYTPYHILRERVWRHNEAYPASHNIFRDVYVQGIANNRGPVLKRLFTIFNKNSLLLT